MRPALLPQRESGAVLYSSHAHRKNIQEQTQTTPALPTQEYTGADADHLALPTQEYTGACSDRPALRSFPTHTAAARATGCRLSLPGHWVRA